MGPASADDRPRLRVLTKGAADTALVRLDEGQFTIGRSTENGLVLHDSLVSRQHAELTYDGDSVQLRDLGGKNPIRVNGEDVHEHELLDGDRISIGQTELLFEFERSRPVSPLRVVGDGESGFDTGVGGISLDAATVAFDRPDLSHAPA
ncbi:MAG: FHA domain-containing protein, partial [Planctomycetota bacterium]|nr:FHA domain-containing protein [Planctomycetota bacterium]